MVGDKPEWLTVENIYEYLGRQVPLDTIRSWIRTKKLPAYKVGPIPTDRNNAVSVAVWANEVTFEERTFTVYNVTIESRWRDADGSWKTGKGYRSSQVPTVIYCLQRAFDWAQAQRDPQNAPF